MARRLPPRYKSGPKKGRFMSKRARSAKRGAPKRKRARARSNPGRTVARRAAPSARPKRRRAAARAPVARRRPRRYKSNPRRFRFFDTLIEGATEAAQILVGKAAVRTIPDLAGLPRAGNLGLAVQTGTALVIGFVADMFVSRNAARALMAGALTAPLETLIVSYDVPWLARALSPATANGQLSAYVRGGVGSGGRSTGIGRYVRTPRISRVSTARGMGDGNYT